VLGELQIPRKEFVSAIFSRFFVPRRTFWPILNSRDRRKFDVFIRPSPPYATRRLSMPRNARRGVIIVSRLPSLRREFRDEISRDSVKRMIWRRKVSQFLPYGRFCDDQVAERMIHDANVFSRGRRRLPSGERGVKAEVKAARCHGIHCSRIQRSRWPIGPEMPGQFCQHSRNFRVSALMTVRSSKIRRERHDFRIRV